MVIADTEQPTGIDPKIFSNYFKSITEYSILRLRLKGVTHREIAKRLNINKDTVWRTLKRPRIRQVMSLINQLDTEEFLTHLKGDGNPMPTASAKAEPASLDEATQLINRLRDYRSKERHLSIKPGETSQRKLDQSDQSDHPKAPRVPEVKVPDCFPDYLNDWLDDYRPPDPKAFRLTSSASAEQEELEEQWCYVGTGDFSG